MGVEENADAAREEASIDAIPGDEAVGDGKPLQGLRCGVYTSERSCGMCTRNGLERAGRSASSGRTEGGTLMLAWLSPEEEEVRSAGLGG